VEDDSGEVGGCDRVEKVDYPRTGVSSVPETYSNFFEFGARAQGDRTKRLHICGDFVRQHLGCVNLGRDAPSFKRFM
jgi:hypothetical protein